MANQGKRMVSENLIAILKEMDSKGVSISDLADMLEAFTDDELQPTLTAGDNIQISEENVISATDTKYTAGTGIEISEDNEISATSASLLTHHIFINTRFTNKLAYVRFNVESTNTTAFTTATLAQWLYNNGHTDNSKSIVCNGIVGTRTQTSPDVVWKYAYACDIFSSNGTQITIQGYQDVETSTGTAPTLLSTNDDSWSLSDIFE